MAEVPQSKLTSPEIAKVSGIPYSTVRELINEFDLQPIGKRKKADAFSPDVIDLLQTIRGLKDEGRGHDTIQRVIGGSVETTGDNTDGQLEMPEAPQSKTEGQIEGPELSEMIGQAVKAAVLDAGATADKYAQATHEIGMLTERVRNLSEMLESERAKTALLLPPERLEIARAKAEQAEREAHRLAAELEKAQADNQALREQAAKKGWLARLLGL